MQVPNEFTVLMALYAKDDPHLFEKAVDSVYRNSLPPDDFVLVIDGPVEGDLDAQVEVVTKRYPLTVVRRSANAGLATALNDGITHVRTEWIARADPDDVNVADRFAIQTRAIYSHPKTDVTGGAILETGRCGEPVSVRVVPLDHASIVKFAVFRNPFNHMTVMFRRSAVLAVGGYPNIYLREDYGLWSLLIANGAQCLNVPEILVVASAGRDMYRRRGGFRNAKAEVRLQAHLVDCGMKSALEACCHGVMRAAGFLLPNTMRGLLYRRILRNKADAFHGTDLT